MSLPSSKPGLPPAASSSAAVVEVAVQIRGEGSSETALDRVAAEVPVALVYNGEPHVVMMATPCDFEDFARGFSVTEGIVGRLDELQIDRVSALDAGDPQAGYEISMRIPAVRHDALRQRRRNLQGRSGCGLCGAQDIAEALRAPMRVPAGMAISPGALKRALEALRGQQPANAATGATHAAAWATPDGLIAAVREDVGRHNALDKLIGCLLQTSTDCTRGFCVVTSRASYEMVQKAATIGMPLLVAISAPTAYAIRLAEEAGITLVGFARGERYVVYACPARLNPTSN
jgi:FdhD protein